MYIISKLALPPVSMVYEMFCTSCIKDVFSNHKVTAQLRK